MDVIEAGNWLQVEMIYVGEDSFPCKLG